MSNLKLEKLTISYEKPDGSKNVIFKNFSREFEPGIYTLIGESGCGKSTLMRAIAGLKEYEAGRILLNGKVLEKANPDVCMMHQHYTDFPWCSAYKNILMAYKAKKIKITSKEKKEAMDILELLGLKEQADKKVGPFNSEISGGQSQRLSFGMCLATKPKVWLLDEPSSALDSANDRNIADILKSYQKNSQAIIIVITHEAEFAKMLNATEIRLDKDTRISE